MTLKDWKKVSAADEEYAIVKYTNKNWKDTSLIIDLYPNHEYSVIVIMGNLLTKSGNTLGTFNKKSKALIYAKQWMRAH